MKRFTLSLAILLFIGSLAPFTMVNADDDHSYEEEEYKWYKGEEWDDADDHHDDYDDNDDYEYDDNYKNNEQESCWYLWNRDVSLIKGELPFNEPKYVSLKSNQSPNELEIYSIPKQGEILVPGKALSDYLGAQVTFYKTSRILEVSKGETELIFRAGTNVAYENMAKTPIPARAIYFDGDVYLPISVVANGLGHSINWNKSEKTFYLRKMIQNQ